VVLAAIGKRCTPSLANDPARHTVVGVLVGGLILLVVYTLPVFGFVIYKLTDLLGLGVVAYTLLILVRAQRMARAGGPGPGDGAAVGGMPGVGGGPPGVPHAEAQRGADFTVDRGGRAEPHFGEAAHGAGPEAPAASAFGDFTADDRQVPPGANPAGDNMSTGGVGASTPGGGPPPYTTSGPAGSGPSGPLPLNTSALPRASFGIRMGALLLDIILIGIVTHQLHDHDVFLVLLAAYGAVMWKLKGSTIGGIICGLQVVRVDGRPIDWPTAIVRALSCFLSLAVVGLGFIWIAIDHDRQGWHDKIAGTAVVRSPKGASLL
jgi:hypothetical protein